MIRQKIEIKAKKQLVESSNDETNNVLEIKEEIHSSPTKEDEVIQSSSIVKKIEIKKKNTLEIQSTDDKSNIVLSFDIGIENLAYCILSIDRSDKTRIIPKPVILQWDIINLINAQSYKCMGHFKKDRVPCNRIPTIYYGKPIHCKTYCKTHLPNDGTITHEIQYTLKCKCKNDAFYYTTNSDGIHTGYCKYHKPSNDLNVNRWITAYNATEFELKSVLFEKLKVLDLINKHNVKHLIIEHQPDITREMMRIISYAVCDYYLIMHQGIQIEYIDAKNKLQIYDGKDEIQCTIKDPHARNKYISKKYTEYLLSSYNLDILSFYMKFSKQDDLADSLLTGVYYLTFHINNITPPSNSNTLALKIQGNRSKLRKIKAIKPKNNKNYTISILKYILKHKLLITPDIQKSLTYYFGNTLYNDLLKDATT